jgi:RHS repeat-associated protein
MATRGADAFTYDYENRLTNASVGSATTQYVYNADSARVKKVVGSTATYYIGNWYEVTNGVATKYYYFGAQRVAMRTSAGVTYLHGDHLGSTSATSGAINSSSTYYPYGAVRSGSLPTDYTFTGQKRDNEANLMFYNARYYDSAIGRFTQPDTIVPNLFNPQSLNRYAYVLNNPVRYTDPTGHKAFGLSEDAELDEKVLKPPATSTGNPKPSDTDDLCNLAKCGWNDAGPSPAHPPQDDPVDEGGPGAGSSPPPPCSSISCIINWIKSWFGQSPTPPTPSPMQSPIPPGWNNTWTTDYGTKTGDSGLRYRDPNGGEWRWHPSDKYHPSGHWDYNPWNTWNDNWQNIDINGNPTPK